MVDSTFIIPQSKGFNKLFFHKSLLGKFIALLIRLKGEQKRLAQFRRRALPQAGRGGKANGGEAAAKE